jgi:hypothetical protein
MSLRPHAVTFAALLLAFLQVLAAAQVARAPTPHLAVALAQADGRLQVVPAAATPDTSVARPLRRPAGQRALRGAGWGLAVGVVAGGLMVGAGAVADAAGACDSGCIPFNTTATAAIIAVPFALLTTGVGAIIGVSR